MGNMKRFFAKLLCAAMLLSLPTGSALASKYGGGEAYAEANFRDLAQTLILMDGVSLEDNKIIDEYAKMNYCSIYKEKFRDDFEWSRFRKLLIQKVQSKKEYFRNLYQISGVIYLGRYNFDTQDFPFINKSALVNVGSLQLFDLNRNSAETVALRTLCQGEGMSQILPDHYVFELNQPLTFDRLKLPMEEAKKLLERMERMDNTDRRLYVRFRMRIISIVPTPIEKLNIQTVIRLRGELTGIDIFLDRALTQPFARVEVK
jgi:hypothetical protein